MFRCQGLFKRMAACEDLPWPDCRGPSITQSRTPRNLRRPSHPNLLLFRVYDLSSVRSILVNHLNIFMVACSCLWKTRHGSERMHANDPTKISCVEGLEGLTDAPESRKGPLEALGPFRAVHLLEGPWLRKFKTTRRGCVEIQNHWTSVGGKVAFPKSNASK